MFHSMSAFLQPSFTSLQAELQSVLFGLGDEGGRVVGCVIGASVEAGLGLGDGVGAGVVGRGLGRGLGDGLKVPRLRIELRRKAPDSVS